MKKNFNEFKNFIKNKRVAVVGIGVSNIPLIHFLFELGADISAFDKKEEGKLGDIAKQFKDKGIKLVLGEDYLERLVGYDVIFKTPSMRIDSKALVDAKNQGAYITSEMEEFVKYCPAKIFGITGSDGKTTTTTLIYNMLKEQGYNAWVGGNIGTPLFSRIEEINENDKVVLELSSFQLMTMNESTNIAVVTNLSPNHLDMHKDMNEYIDAKKNIFKYQNKKDTLVLNRENDITRSFETEAKGNVLMFSSKREIEKGAYYKEGVLYLDGNAVCEEDEIVIKGMDNVENYLAAFCAVREDVSIENMKKVATTFSGVEHRREFVREFNGIRYYNDSIASSPTRTLSGLKAYQKPVILIAGGYDKHLPFGILAEEGYDKIKALIILGATKEKIRQEFERVIYSKNIKLPIYEVETLLQAVELSTKIGEEGDIVTLSPACASFDMYPNFEVRGNCFKEIVNKL